VGWCITRLRIGRDWLPVAMCPGLFLVSSLLIDLFAFWRVGIRVPIAFLSRSYCDWPPALRRDPSRVVNHVVLCSDR
jgi:hypothetical protein